MFADMLKVVLTSFLALFGAKQEMAPQGGMLVAHGFGAVGDNMTQPSQGQLSYNVVVDTPVKLPGGLSANGFGSVGDNRTEADSMLHPYEIPHNLTAAGSGGDLVMTANGSGGDLVVSATGSGGDVVVAATGSGGDVVVTATGSGGDLLNSGGGFLSANGFGATGDNRTEADHLAHPYNVPKTAEAAVGMISAHGFGATGDNVTVADHMVAADATTADGFITSHGFGATGDNRTEADGMKYVYTIPANATAEPFAAKPQDA